MISAAEKESLYNYALTYVLTKKGTLCGYHQEHELIGARLQELRVVLETYKIQTGSFNHPVEDILKVVDCYCKRVCPSLNPR